MSYDDSEVQGDPSHVTLIMNVDPLLEPANGPTLFPFDPRVTYEIKVDNDHDAVEDVVFEFRFQTEPFRLPDVYTAVAGIGAAGANAPGTDTLVVPPRITDFDSPGLNLVQTYNVRMRRGPRTSSIPSAGGDILTNSGGGPFYAVPGNAGPRTMDYAALYDLGTYTTANGVKVFAGTVDDPFWIDLGAAFDTANFRTLGSGIPGVLTADEDSADQNFASDTISGYAVNTIAIEVPIQMLTSTGMVEAASSAAATIGVWATTSRNEMVQLPWGPTLGPLDQLQRMGNPLINELIIGIGSKDKFSMAHPKDDVQFAGTFLDPPIAQIVQALYGGALTVPAAPRADLLPLVTYAAPIAAPGPPPARLPISCGSTPASKPRLRARPTALV